MIIAAIRFKSGTGVQLEQETDSVTEAESQILDILNKKGLYATFKDTDGSTLVAKKSEIEGFTVADVREEDVDETKTD